MGRHRKIKFSTQAGGGEIAGHSTAADLHQHGEAESHDSSVSGSSVHYYLYMFSLFLWDYISAAAIGCLQ